MSFLASYMILLIKKHTLKKWRISKTRAHFLGYEDNYVSKGGGGAAIWKLSWKDKIWAIALLQASLMERIEELLLKLSHNSSAL